MAGHDGDINPGAGAYPAGLIWAVDQGADVVNMSFAAPAADHSAEDLDVVTVASEYAQLHDVVLVAGGGNCGPESDCEGVGAELPAGLEGVVGVGAVTTDLDLAGFSSRTSVVDVVAPGEEIETTASGGGFESFRGTSAASPHVAGAVAVARSGQSVPAGQVIEALVSSAVPLESATDELGAGAGLIHVGDFVESVGVLPTSSASTVPTSSTLPPPPVPTLDGQDVLEWLPADFCPAPSPGDPPPIDSASVIAFGDVDGDAATDAFAVVACAPGAGGAFISLFAYSPTAGLLGWIPYGQGLEPALGASPEAVTFEGDRIVIEHVRTDEDDPRCCPSQLVREVWQFDGTACELLEQAVVES